MTDTPDLGLPIKKSFKLLPEHEREHAETQIAGAAKLVKFDTRDYEVEHIVRKYEAGEYYVPDYQREFVWQERDKSRFIESLLIGLPIQPLFFWQAEDGRFEIVDGSQRIRTMAQYLSNDLKLQDMDLLPAVEGFRFQDLIKSRQRRFQTRIIRGILLDYETSVANRIEMFSRINVSGVTANAAEIRRGALPGPIMSLIANLADNQQFTDLTPLPKRQVSLREREELVARFVAYTQGAQNPQGDRMFHGYKDRPANYIFEMIKEANDEANTNPSLVSEIENRFMNMLTFVELVFPHGFRKPDGGRQVPRARYEAIAIGTGLAIMKRPELLDNIDKIPKWTETDDFVDATTSEGANTRSKLEGRIGFVRDSLLSIEL